METKHQPVPDYHYTTDHRLHLLSAQRRYVMKQGNQLLQFLQPEKSSDTTPADLLTDVLTIWPQETKTPAPRPSAAGLIGTMQYYCMLMEPHSQAEVADAFLRKEVVPALVGLDSELAKSDQPNLVISDLAKEINRRRHHFNRQHFPGATTSDQVLGFELSLTVTYSKDGQDYYAGFSSPGIEPGFVLPRERELTPAVPKEDATLSATVSHVSEMWTSSTQLHFNAPPTSAPDLVTDAFNLFSAIPATDGDEVILSANLRKRGHGGGIQTWKPDSGFKTLVLQATLSQWPKGLVQLLPITLTRMKLLPIDDAEILSERLCCEYPLGAMINYLEKYQENVKRVRDSKSDAEWNQLDEVHNALEKFISNLNQLIATVRLVGMRPATTEAFSSLLWATIDLVSSPITLVSIEHYKHVKNTLLGSHGKLSKALEAEWKRNRLWMAGNMLVAAAGVAFFAPGILSQQGVMAHLSGHVGNLFGFDFALHHAFMVGGGLALVIGFIGAWICFRDMKICEHFVAEQEIEDPRLGNRLVKTFEEAAAKNCFNSIEPVQIAEFVTGPQEDAEESATSDQEGRDTGDQHFNAEQDSAQVNIQALVSNSFLQGNDSASEQNPKFRRGEPRSPVASEQHLASV